MKRKSIIIAGFLALVVTLSLAAQAPPRPGAAPNPPSNLRTGNIGDSQASIQWNNAGQGISYRVYYNTQNNSNGAQTRDVNATAVNLTGLNPNTNYWVWVSSIQNGREGNLSAAVNFRTAAPPPPPAPPTPSNIRTNNITHEQATIQWDDVRGRRVNYKVYYNTSNNPRGAQSVNAGNNSTTLSGLNANTNYWVWVSSTEGNQESSLSSAVQFRTAAPPPPPAPPAPSNLRSTGITHNSVSLQWDGDRGRDSRNTTYRVIYNTSNNQRGAQTFNSNNNSAEITGLNPETNYFFWVIAIRDGQESDRSSSIQVGTTAAPRSGAPPRPRN
jgi:chitodextrinase